MVRMLKAGLWVKATMDVFVVFLVCDQNALRSTVVQVYECTPSISYISSEFVSEMALPTKCDWLANHDR